MSRIQRATRARRTHRRGMARLAIGFGPLLAAMLVAAAAASLTASARADEPGGSQQRVIVRKQVVTPQGVNTVIEIPVSQDSFIASNFPNTNYGTSNTLNLGYESGGVGAMRMLLQANLAAIPANSIINVAQFQIYQYDVRPPNDYPMGFQAQYMRSAWSETGVTWNNANYLGGTPLPVGQVDNALGWKYFTVTDLVRSWVGGAQPNYGVIITGDESPTNNRMRRFYSRQQSGYYPRLIVDYTVACDNVAPTAGVAGLPTYEPGSFTVNWGGYDSAPPGCSPSGIAYYDVQYRINGGGWASWINQTTATAATFNAAANGAYVEFRARAVDNAGNVQAWSGPQTATTVDSAPPSASMSPLPPYTITPAFYLYWSGTDNLSGIASYDVQFREVGGDWQWLIQNTPQTSYYVTGAQSGVTYEVRARATDNVGNVQPWTGAQAATTVFYYPVAVVLPFNPPILKPTAPVTSSFLVNWGGYYAPGTSITSYSIYYNYNGAGWQLWQSFPGSQTNASFPWEALGLGDGTYQFEATATNNLSQTEPLSNQPEASIFVDMADRMQVRSIMPLITKNAETP